MSPPSKEKNVLHIKKRMSPPTKNNNNNPPILLEDSVFWQNFKIGLGIAVIVIIIGAYIFMS